MDTVGHLHGKISLNIIAIQQPTAAGTTTPEVPATEAAHLLWWEVDSVRPHKRGRSIGSEQWQEREPT